MLKLIIYKKLSHEGKQTHDENVMHILIHLNSRYNRFNALRTTTKLEGFQEDKQYHF